MCPDCLSSLGEKTETDRYAPFIIATNDALERLEYAPEGTERIIFHTSHLNDIQIQSGEARHIESQTLW
jgi:hypothetical protein